MNKNLIRGRKTLLSLAMFLACGSVNAAVVEHSADRYIINVSEMNLNGDETLYDILMMCPEVLSFDGKTVLGGDSFKELYGAYALRIDNMEYGADYATFLKTLRASEIAKIKVCTYPGVLKGCGGLKKVIDINLRKGENGVSGRVALSGDTYGGGNAFVSTLSQQDNVRFMAIAEGNMQRSSNEGVTNHGSHEAVKLNLLWDITSKDNLELDFKQNFNRNRQVGDIAGYGRSSQLDFAYTRTLSEAGAYALIQGAVDYSTNSATRETNPFALAEFAFPLVNHNFWVTAGIESGYSEHKNVAIDYTDNSRYEDLYAQLDWTVGKWSFSIGDRFRMYNFWLNSLKQGRDFETTATNHAYTATVYHRFNEGNTIQGTFARRYYGPGYSTFVLGNDYTPDYAKNPVYISELKHTYSKPSLVISTSVKNIRQDIENGHDNTLGAGVSAFWHKDIFRVNAGFNYFWQKQTPDAGNAVYNNFAVFKLAPQVVLPCGWKFTSTMIYSTNRNEKVDTIHEPANFYADAALTKTICKKWLFEAKYHDIVGQHKGNRAATVGVTYYWGK